MDQYELTRFVHDVSLLDQLLNNPPLDARQVEGTLDDLLVLPMNEEYMKRNKCFNYNLDNYKASEEKNSNDNISNLINKKDGCK
jgi:hypothetical protein